MNQALLESFVCPICIETCNEAVQASCCKSLYCKECTQKLSKKCALCMQICRFEKSIQARRLINMLEATCECGYKCMRSDLSLHRQRCIKRTKAYSKLNPQLKYLFFKNVLFFIYIVFFFIYFYE